MPIRTALVFVLPFMPVAVSLLAALFSVVVPEALVQLGVAAEPLTAPIVDALGQAGDGSMRMVLPAEQIVIDDLIITVDLFAILAGFVLILANTISARRFIVPYIEYRFQQPAAEWATRYRLTAPLMVLFALACLAELVFGATSLRLLEMHFDGTPISFERFLYRVVLFFSFVGPVLVFGSSLFGMQLLARASAARRETHPHS